MVINAANPEIFGGFQDGFGFFYKGTARFSVPAGTYWAIGDFTSDNFTQERLAVLLRPALDRQLAPGGS